MKQKLTGLRGSTIDESITQDLLSAFDQPTFSPVLEQDIAGSNTMKYISTIR